jgi:uncharacterized protein
MTTQKEVRTSQKPNDADRMATPARVDKLLTPRPGEVVIRDLSRDETEEIIKRNRVARIAFSFHDRVDIEPIHYIYEHGWLYGRTSEGSKLAAIQHNQWIAFEIDEAADLFDWRSVVIHGSFWILHPRGSPRAEELWERAARLSADIVPGALTDSDPVAFRHILFRIAVGDARGREAKVRPSQSSDTRHMEER